MGGAGIIFGVQCNVPTLSINFYIFSVISRENYDPENFPTYPDFLSESLRNTPPAPAIGSYQLVKLGVPPSYTLVLWVGTPKHHPGSI